MLEEDTAEGSLLLPSREGAKGNICWVFCSPWLQRPCPLHPGRVTPPWPPFLGFVSFPLEARQGSFTQARLPVPSVSLTF